MINEPKFNCPYCNSIVQIGDKHAYTIEKKNIRDKTTIIVQCILTRTFSIILTPVDEEK